MDIDERLELEKYMYNDIKDSIAKEGSFKGLAWYELSTFNSFYSELLEIEDNDGNIVGEGIETGEYKFILNEKTEDDFIIAFAYAREKACREYREENKISPLAWMGPLIAGIG